MIVCVVVLHDQSRLVQKHNVALRSNLHQAENITTRKTLVEQFGLERGITADDRSHDEGNGNMALRSFDQGVPRHDPVGRPKGAYPDPIVGHPPKSHDRRWRISQDRHRVSDIAGGDKVVIVATQDKEGLRHIAVASDEVWIEPYV